MLQYGKTMKCIIYLFVPTRGWLPPGMTTASASPMAWIVVWFPSRRIVFWYTWMAIFTAYTCDVRGVNVKDDVIDYFKHSIFSMVTPSLFIKRRVSPWLLVS